MQHIQGRPGNVAVPKTLPNQVFIKFQSLKISGIPGIPKNFKVLLNIKVAIPLSNSLIHSTYFEGVGAISMLKPA